MICWIGKVEPKHLKVDLEMKEQIIIDSEMNDHTLGHWFRKVWMI